MDGAAVRELREETGLSGLALTPVGFFSLPGRDKRAWTMSEGFATLLTEDGPEPQAGDDAREAAWFAVNSRWAQGVLTLSFEGPERFEAKLVRDGSYAFSILDTGGLAFDHAHIIARAMHAMGFLQPEAADYDTMNAQLASLVEGVPHSLANRGCPIPWPTCPTPPPCCGSILAASTGLGSTCSKGTSWCWGPSWARPPASRYR